MHVRLFAGKYCPAGHVTLFALQLQLAPLQLALVPAFVPPLVLYPVLHVPLHALLLTVPFVQFVHVHADQMAYIVVELALAHAVEYE